MSLPLWPGARPAAPVDDPVDALLACHRRAEAFLATLERIAAALPDPARAGEVKEALPAALRYFEESWRLHALDEDGSVFPRLRDLPLCDELETEHRAHEAIFLALRDCARAILAAPALPPELVGPFGAHVAAFAAGTREHLRKEEADVFPRARALPEPERRAIALEMRLRRGSAA